MPELTAYEKLERRYADLEAENARLREALKGIAPWLAASLDDYTHDGNREYGKACDAVFDALKG